MTDALMDEMAEEMTDGKTEWLKMNDMNDLTDKRIDEMNGFKNQNPMTNNHQPTQSHCCFLLNDPIQLNEVVLNAGPALIAGVSEGLNEIASDCLRSSEIIERDAYSKNARAEVRKTEATLRSLASNQTPSKKVASAKLIKHAPPTPDFGFNEPAISTLSRGGYDIQIAPRAIFAPNPSLVIGVVNGVEAAAEVPTSVTRDSSTATLTTDVTLTLIQDRITDYSKLNKSDITELELHPELLTPNQIRLLQSVKRKRELYPQRYRDDYLRHSSILLLTTGWSSAQRYSMCSVPNSINRSGQCKLHKFCPYCSFLEKQHCLARYVPVYDYGNWFFLTGSFNGDLNLTDLSDYFELVSYWDAYKSTLRQLVNEKLIRGVFWTEELAVNSIATTKVLPHIHATIEADEVNDETLFRFSELVAANLKSLLGPDILAPNIQVKNLNSQRKLLSHLQYQIKPIKLVKAYDLAWSRCSHNDRAGVVRLNSETTDLVLGYSHITNRRTKIETQPATSIQSPKFISELGRRIGKRPNLLLRVWLG